MKNPAAAKSAVRGTFRAVSLCGLAVGAMSLPGCQRIVDVTGSVRVDGTPTRG